MTLTTPNASAFVRGLAASTARISEVPTPHRTLWDPATCPSELLAWLAWTYSVDLWDPAWSDDVKRAAIATSIQVHRAKGTIDSIRRAIAALGLSASFVEWWEAGSGLSVHEFRLLVDTHELGITPEGHRTLSQIIEATKPVRSHMAELQIDTTIPAATTWAGGAALDGAYTYATVDATSLPADAVDGSIGLAGESAPFDVYLRDSGTWYALIAYVADTTERDALSAYKGAIAVVGTYDAPGAEVYYFDGVAEAWVALTMSALDTVTPDTLSLSMLDALNADVDVTNNGTGPGFATVAVADEVNFSVSPSSIGPIAEAGTATVTVSRITGDGPRSTTLSFVIPGGESIDVAVSSTRDDPSTFAEAADGAGAVHSWSFDGDANDLIGAWDLTTSSVTIDAASLPQGADGRATFAADQSRAFEAVGSGLFDRSAARTGVVIFTPTNASPTFNRAIIMGGTNYNAIQFAALVQKSGTDDLGIALVNTNTIVATLANAVVPSEGVHILALIYDPTDTGSEIRARVWTSASGWRTVAVSAAANSAASQFLLGSPSSSLYSCPMQVYHSSTYDAALDETTLDVFRQVLEA